MDVELSDAFTARLRAFIARRLAGAPDQDDVFQETIARLLKRMDQGAFDRAGLEPYAFRIAENLLTDRLRARKRETVELPDSLADEQPRADAVLIAREEFAAVRAAIDAMPPLRRQVFLAVRVQGKTHREISEALDLSQGAIEKHMTRALADLVAARRRTRRRSRPAASGGPHG